MRKRKQLTFMKIEGVRFSTVVMYNTKTGYVGAHIERGCIQNTEMVICAACGEERAHHSKGMCRQCYGRQYREDHKEQEAARCKQYHKDHKEENAVRCKQYHKDHKEEHAAYCKQWRADHPEHDREQYLKHGEEKRERSRQWRADHPNDAKTYSDEHRDEAKQWRTDHPNYAKIYNREHPKEPRDYVTPAGNCAHLNTWFDGCVRHHVTPDEIIHIPAGMHRSIWHNMRTGAGMNDINRLAFAFLNGQRNASAQMTISDF